MNKIFEQLFDEFCKEKANSGVIEQFQSEIDRNEQCLKAHLSKNQRRMLLRIIDAKGLILEESRKESFISGFKLGLKIGYEANNNG